MGNRRKILLPKTDNKELNFDKLDTSKGKYKDDFEVDDTIDFEKGNMIYYIKKLIKDDNKKYHRILAWKLVAKKQFNKLYLEASQESKDELDKLIFPG